MTAWVRLNSQLRSSPILGAVVLIFANLFFASASGSVSLNVTPVGPGANCGLVLGGPVIFCEPFDTVNPGIPSRTGALDPNVWGVSRTTGNTNLGAFANDWAATTLQSCTGPIGPVLPPNDIVICNGQLREATNDNPANTFDLGGVIALTMYPKQPFDFAGRTGTVSFDVSNDSEGSHSAWPEFWITNLPVPGPFAHFKTWQALPQFGFGIRLDGYIDANGNPNSCPEGSPGHIGVGAVILINNYIGNDTDNAGNTVSVQGHDCVVSSTGPGNMNHFEVRVSQNQIDVYGTDAGVTPTAANLKHLATISNANLGFTRGLVWIDDVHYNADKGGTPSQRQHTFSWDNIAFDGPFVYRDFSYDALDNNTPDANGSVDLGKYALAGSSTSWNVLGMPGSPNPAATRVLFNFYHAAPPANLTVTVNGHAHIVPWPYPDMLAATWRTYALTIPTTDLVAGSNVVTIGSPDQAINVANVNIVLVDVPGGVPILPGNPTTYPSGQTPIPTVTLTASPTSITAGRSSILTWSSTNATACSGSGGWSGTLATKGARSVAPSANATYTLTCTRAGGSNTASATVTVTTASTPTVTLTATPTSITAGQSSTLTWSSTNATSCSASGSWSGKQTVSGSLTLSPTANSTYTLTCAGAGRSASASANITVTGSSPTAGCNLSAPAFCETFNH
jgi:hypothetical protein